MKLVSECVLLRSSVLRFEDSINVYLFNGICFVDSTHHYFFSMLLLLLVMVHNNGICCFTCLSFLVACIALLLGALLP